ncbi:MAG: hypothetical protein IKZ16_06920 [Clostridia bacterium]|nr:hypothetical protein [Clostridia bacterium]
MKTKLIRIPSLLLAVLLLVSAFTTLPLSVGASSSASSAGADARTQTVTTGTDSTGAYKRLEALIERGSLASTYDLGYTMADYKGNVRTAFDVKTGGATRVAIEAIAVSYTGAHIQFFSSNYEKVGSTSYTEGAVKDIPANCEFIRIEINTTAELETLALRFYGGGADPSEAMRVAKREPSERLTYKVSDDLFTTARLMLPPNYKTEGTKVPLVLWLEGSGSGFSSWSGDFNSDKQEYLNYLRDEGYAVLSIYAWGNKYAEKYPKCGMSYPYPIPTNMACIEQGIKYVCSRYNVDIDNLHIMSKSQGGQSALYYASNNVLNAKSIGMFAPVLDYLSMPGEALYKDTRAAIAEDMGFVGDIDYFASEHFLSYSTAGRAFLHQNLDKLALMNEAWTGLTGASLEALFQISMNDCQTFWTQEIWKTDRTDIYTNHGYAKTASVPVKIWGAPDDAATPYLKMVETVEQLKNGGSVAELVTLPRDSGGHSAADYGNKVATVTTALGIEYENIPIGWVENVAWIRAHSPAGTTHTYTPTVVAPTCVDQGYTHYVCECGEEFKTDFVRANGRHKYTDWVVVVEPQPGVEGLEQKLCTVCGTVWKEQAVAALPESKLGLILAAVLTPVGLGVAVLATVLIVKKRKKKA